MVKHRFDGLVRAVGADPKSRRNLLAALTLGLIGSGAMIPLASEAAGTEGRCAVRCKKGCCSKKFPKCCDKYRLCCPKKAKYCGPGGCYR
jgi:hypothetical protein